MQIKKNFFNFGRGRAKGTLAPLLLLVRPWFAWFMRSLFSALYGCARSTDDMVANRNPTDAKSFLITSSVIVLRPSAMVAKSSSRKRSLKYDFRQLHVNNFCCHRSSSLLISLLIIYINHYWLYVYIVLNERLDYDDRISVVVRTTCWNCSTTGPFSASCSVSSVFSMFLGHAHDCR